MGSKNAYASVRQKITMKMLNIPACAYLVQIFTTSFDFSIDAASAESILMFCLMYSTARKAPVVTACMEAPVNQYTVAPPINRPSRTRGSTKESVNAVSYTHLRAHETPEHLVCRLLLEKKKK